MQSRNKPIIRHIITLGDSLSGRGTFAHRYLFGIIPLALVTGLDKESVKGRFTNGYTWDDDFAEMLSEEFLISYEEKKHSLDTTDISDGVLDDDPEIMEELARVGDLSDDMEVCYKGRDLVRTYNEGGLTASDYSGDITLLHPLLMLSREIVSNLAQKRKALLEDDLRFGITADQKEKTLVIEWSGANDLITVNEVPTEAEAKRAVQARVENLEILYAAGYRHFVLFNLPDLSLTPRYQISKRDQLLQVKAVTAGFNHDIAEACDMLRGRYPDLMLDLFNVDAFFQNVYNNPEQFGFDREKLRAPFVYSSDFNLENGVSNASGYLFWDDVHPTANLHEILADTFYTLCEREFSFAAPMPQLVVPPRLTRSSPPVTMWGHAHHTSPERKEVPLPDAVASAERVDTEVPRPVF